MTKSFYFLHMDKTVSLAFDANIMTQLYDVIGSKGIDVSLNLRHNDHNFWRPTRDDCFIFSVFRDPIKRSVSEFCYTMMYDTFNEYRAIDIAVKQNTYNITMENFEKWLYTEHTSNYQSKTLLGRSDLVWSSNDLNNHLKRIDLLLRTSDLHQNNQLNFFNHVLDRLNLNTSVLEVPAYYEEGWYDHVGLDFYLKLLSEGGQLLEDLKHKNKIDLEVWDTNSFFPSGLSSCF